MKSEIEKVRNIEQYFKHSALATAKLYSVQKQTQLPSEMLALGTRL
jgi:hypothetical protein